MTNLKTETKIYRKILMNFKYILSIVLILITISSVSAMKLPVQYGPNTCELIAKDFQKEFGGSLVWIQPLYANGAYVEGEYSGHMINKVYIRGNKQYFYIDWKTQSIMRTEEEVSKMYYTVYGRLDIRSSKIQMWDLDKERPPFPIIWNY